MFRKRIFVGALLIVGSYFLVTWSAWTMALEVLTIGILGLNEFYNLAFRKGIRPSKATGILCGFILFCTSFAYNERHYADTLTLLILYTLIVFICRKSYHVSTFIDSGVTILGYLYVAWLFSFIILLRKPTGLVAIGPWHLEQGAVCVMFLVFATSFSDIGAFFIGKFFGRRKLCPGISPGKTVEGSIGGVVAAVITSGIWGYVTGLPLIHCAILAVLISVFAQIGDLWESILKRDVSVKDSGDIIAGHGGVLDRFDSLFITAPVAYFYFKYLILFF